MSGFRSNFLKIFPGIICALLLLLAACGDSSPPSVDNTATAEPLTPVPVANVDPTALPEPTPPKALPTPRAVPTQAPSSSLAGLAKGQINVGVGALGSLDGAWDPKELASPVLSRLNMTVYETLVVSAPNGDLTPRLAEDWQVSEDGLVWTFTIRGGVSFHDDSQDLSADDVEWTWTRSIAEDSNYGGAAPVRSLLDHPNRIEKVNLHTITVVNEKPRFDMLFSFRAPYRHGLAVLSQASFEKGTASNGEAALNGTGPWRLTEASPEDFWKLEAVPDHWRETPKFQELVLWQIPEESTRVASLQSGSLDTAEIEAASISSLRNVPGMEFARAPDMGQFAWNLHGQFYSTNRPGYDASLPWVSANQNPQSLEWDRARKVRLAMAMAIDRETLVEEELNGQGRAQHYWIDAGNSWLDPLKEEDPTPYKYDPERARQLLAEAGYPQGIEVEVACYPRGIPFEMEVCRRIATEMWPAAGIQTSLNELTYNDLRPDMLQRGLGLLAPHSLGTYTEPMALYPNGAWMLGGWNAGFEHPDVDALIAEALTQANPDQRAETTRTIARWIRDEVTHIPVYTPDLFYPAGPKIKPWPLQGGEKTIIHNFEFIEPR